MTPQPRKEGSFLSRNTQSGRIICCLSRLYLLGGFADGIELAMFK
jgi:hypothetical protein